MTTHPAIATWCTPCWRQHGKWLGPTNSRSHWRISALTAGLPWRQPRGFALATVNLIAGTSEGQVSTSLPRSDDTTYMTYLALFCLHFWDKGLKEEEEMRERIPQ